MLRKIFIFALLLIVSLQLVRAGGDINAKEALEGRSAVLSVSRDTTDVATLIANESDDVETLAAEPAEAPAQTGLIPPDQFNADKFISDRLIKRTAVKRQCSFTCDHKQDGFSGCLCGTSVTYSTYLSECPDDVSKINSADLKWAWEQCTRREKGTNCICPTLGQVVKMQRSVLVAVVLKVIDVVKASAVQLYRIVRDVYVSKEWAYNPSKLLINTFVHAKNLVKNILEKIKLNKTIATLKSKLSNANEKLKTFKNKVVDKLKDKAKDVAQKIVTIGKKWKSLGEVAKKRLGLTGTALLNKLQKWEQKVQKFNKKFSTQLKKIKNEIGTKAGKVVAETKTAVSKTWKKAATMWKKAHNNTKTAVNKTVATVKRSMSGVVNSAKNKIKSIVRF